MDLEAIFSKGKFHLLEIDARFPSQTPMAVYWSTGINLLVELAACFMPLPPNTHRPKRPRRIKGVVFEQFQVVSGERRPHGERIFSTLGPVHIEPGFMGATEALVAGDPKSERYAVTLITVK
jgi:pyrrolysine biosynthesis protein PylC